MCDYTQKTDSENGNAEFSIHCLLMISISNVLSLQITRHFFLTASHMNST